MSNKTEIAVEEVDIATSPLRAWKDGVRFIPTLKNGDKTLTGILLSRAEIQSFLQEAGAQL